MVMPANRSLLLVLALALVPAVTAAAIGDDLHLNIQTTNATGSIVNGTFAFVFNISKTQACDQVLYSNVTTQTTDQRGIISYTLSHVALNFPSPHPRLHAGRLLFPVQPA